MGPTGTITHELRSSPAQRMTRPSLLQVSGSTRPASSSESTTQNQDHAGRLVGDKLPAVRLGLFQRPP